MAVVVGQRALRRVGRIGQVVAARLVRRYSITRGLRSPNRPRTVTRMMRPSLTLPTLFPIGCSSHPSEDHGEWRRGRPPPQAGAFPDTTDRSGPWCCPDYEQPLVVPQLPHT